MTSRSFEGTLAALRKRLEDWPLVGRLAGPSLVEMLLTSITLMADMMMVGRLGSSSIAAVGLSVQPMFLLQSVFMGLNVGVTALVAQSIGAGNPEGARDCARQAVMLSAVLAAAVGLCAGLCSSLILRAMGAAPDVVELGSPYFSAVSLGIPFVAVGTAIAACLRGAGDMKAPMRINIAANVLNVIGNYLLIYGKCGLPRLGVLGAGVSTTASRGFALAAFLSYLARNGLPNQSLGLFHGGPPEGSSGARGPNDRERLAVGRIKVPLSVSGFRFNLKVIGRIQRIGTPAALEQIVMRGGQVVFTRVVASLGTTAYAAHQVGMNVLSLSFLPGTAFSMAATTLVGQHMGAGMPREAQEKAVATRDLGLLMGLGLACIFAFLGRPVGQMYTNDEAVLGATASLLRLYSLVQPFQSTQLILAGALRGAGDSKWPLYSTFLGMWIGRVALAWVLVGMAGWGLLGAWTAMGMDQATRALMILARFRSGKWKELGATYVRKGVSELPLEPE